MQILTSRKCIATGKILPIENLVRIVRQKDGQVFVDSDLKGRGAYITRDIALFDKVRKNRLLNKAFRTNVNKSVYDELEKVLKEA